MSDPPSRLAAFIAELKRRRVFRVAVVYAGVAFIIIQLVDGIFDIMGTPPWVGQVVVVLLILGFPIAVALAWAFDITEKGIVRTRGKAQAPATSRRPILTNWTLGVVAALAVIVAAWALLREPSPGGVAISSIAVLPLENLMNDPDQDYFVDGMHEALISELGKISALRVIGRTSVMQYKAAPKPLPEIAEELDVEAVVEGSVLRAGDQVRITAQLMGAKPERHLWTDSYSRDLRDILTLQSEVARAVAKEIKDTLTPEEEARLTESREVNPEAYDLYLKAWHFRLKETPEGNMKAVDYLEQAVAIDPTFAQAYALLAWGYLMLDYFGVMSSREARTKARAAVERALELDDTLPDTHVYLGIYLYLYEWDWTGAERALKRAVELDPNHVHARYEYGLFLGRLGRFEEALVELQRAKELDPLSLQIDFGIGTVYLHNRQYDKAIEQFEGVLELDPNQHSTRWNLAWAYILESMYAESLEEFQKMGFRPGIMSVYYAMGRKTEALAYFDSLKVADVPQGVMWAGRASIYSLLGDKEEALNLLDEAYRRRSWDMFMMQTYQAFDSLRAEPRFKALLQKLGLPEVFDQNGQRIR